MKRHAINRRRLKDAVAGYGFIAPATMLLITFVVLPIIISVILSFAKYNGFSELEWIGWKNYADVFKDPDFLASMKNTAIYVVTTVPIQTLLSLLLAAVLAAKFRNPFGELVRGTLFIPVLCSSVLAGTIFYYLFASDSESMANLLLAMFGLDKQNWLGQRSTALAVICLVAVWKNVGYYLVIFYAGIMDVPANLYEAARVDGASAIQQFLYVTLPGIKPILYTVLTLGTIWAFQVFDITYVMTKGGPGNATTSPVLVLYNAAFSSRRLGYASAIACILAIIIFIVTMVLRVAFREKAGGEDA